MAFQLKPGESVRKGLRRVLRKELDAAMSKIRGNRPPDEGVHKARKHIKKARAVIRLIEPSIDIKKAPQRLRHAARLLSPMRDAVAIAEDAEKLLSSGRRSLSDKTSVALRHLLKRRKVRSRDSAERHHAVTYAKGALARVRRASDTWKWSEVQPRDFEKALQRSYKRARRQMKDAVKTRDPAQFHEWRKRVKLLGYGLRLLKRTVPALHRRIAQLERIDTWLGHDHNLFVLCVSAKGKLPPGKGADRIPDLVTRHQKKLRRMALHAGALLFKESPNIFGKHLATLRLKATEAARPR